jgi:hypothetical protein
MQSIRPIIISLLTIIAAGQAMAGPYTDKLSSCFADNTSGRDRKQFARWMFVAMSEHPEMHDIASLTKNTKDSVSQEVGKMVTRLLTENCTDQAKAAIQNEGGASFQGAFGVLGQLAMQELLSAPEVNAAMSSFESHIDREKVQKALSPK